MNVIIANKYKDAFNDLNIDVSKRLDGEFDVNEIINSFSVFYYNKMFLDITALKNYKDLKTIQQLSIGLDMNKLILLLDPFDEETTNSLYLSRLVSMGIYNFTKDKTNLMYLYNNPNSYKDVAHIQQFDNNQIQVNEKVIVKQQRILGIRNITDNAGATSLIYMLKKVLSNYYNVVAIEVNKRDFIFLQDKDMISINESELGNTIIKYNSYDIVLVDLNNFNGEEMCNDVIYLIEPSTIKLNKMIMLDREIFNKLHNKKIILNQSLLNENDIKDFERESNSKVFYNLPPLDDKKDNSNILLPFLEKMGFVRAESNQNSSNDDNKIFGLFKF